MVDDEMLSRLYRSGKLVVFAEQNNGYLFQNFLKPSTGKRTMPAI